MVKILSGTVAVVMAGFVFVSCLSPAQQKLQEGDTYFAKKEWDRAVVSYMLAGQMDPQLNLSRQVAASYNNKAAQSFSAGDYESAIFNYDKALESAGDTGAGFDIAYARYKVGMVYLQQGRWTDAVKSLGAAIRGGYSKGEAYLARARAYNNLDMYSGAIGDASTCLDLVPQSAEAFLLRGYAHLFSGIYDKAVTDLTSAIWLDTLMKDAYLYRGMALKEQGEYKSAIGDFRRLVELDPSSVPGLIWLGRSYYLATDYYAGIDQFTRAIQLNKGDFAVAFNDRAVCLGRVGEYNAAVADLNLLIRMKPAFALSYYNLGVLYMKMNQPPNGIDQLDTYLCLDTPDKFGCRELALGWRMYNIGYNLCCIQRTSSSYVLERCNRIMADSRGAKDIPYGADALYFQSENDWAGW